MPTRYAHIFQIYHNYNPNLGGKVTDVKGEVNGRGVIMGNGNGNKLKGTIATVINLNYNY